MKVFADNAQKTMYHPPYNKNINSQRGLTTDLPIKTLCAGTSKSHLYFFRLVNVISPGKISQKQIDGAKMTFKQMELINKFIDACKSLGVPDHEAFATVDLYEEQNMVQVITCISALMRKVRTHCYII